jgi:acyl-CoA reductase-like NAD-dependent aldehyde dehydrogenase
VPVSLELGGKSPSIVFPDANEDWVIDGIIAAMRSTGAFHGMMAPTTPNGSRRV